jgi:hypothetical protein
MSVDGTCSCRKWRVGFLESFTQADYTTAGSLGRRFLQRGAPTSPRTGSIRPGDCRPCFGIPWRRCQSASLVLVHHTNKPPLQPKRQEWLANDHAHAGSGGRLGELGEGSPCHSFDYFRVAGLPARKTTALEKKHRKDFGL